MLAVPNLEDEVLGAEAEELGLRVLLVLDEKHLAVDRPVEVLVLGRELDHPDGERRHLRRQKPRLRFQC